MMPEEIGALLWPRGHSPLLARRRAAAIAVLVGAFASLFAVLTVGWIAMDAWAFAADEWHPLAAARIATALAFAALAWACRRPEVTLRGAHARVLALLAIPSAFFVATIDLASGIRGGELAQSVAALYRLVPFVLAAGLATLPLVAAESAAFALVAFALEGWAIAHAGGSALALTPLAAIWLLFLITGVAAFAALNQVRLLTGIIERATRDPLTGCLRRESGGELLAHQFRLSQRAGTALAVLFADLDRFKSVNDAWGHEAGDEVLVNAASALRAAARGSDAVLRWGGEEFVVMLPGATAAEALRFVERLADAGVGRLPDGRHVTLSIGIAERAADAVADAAALVDLADRRMYAAKQAGRNRCVHGETAAPLPVIRE